MAVSRAKVSSSFFVCIAIFLIVTKCCSAGCGFDGDGQCSARIKREVSGDRHPKIPLSLAQALNNADSFDDMLELIDGGDIEEPIVAEEVRAQESVSNRFGGPSETVIEARGAKSQSTKPAKCQPMLVPVPVPQPNDTNTWYIPECVFLERCSGCCNIGLYQCEPTKSEPVVVQVGIYHPTGYNRRGDEKKREAIVMDKHTKCRCDCKVKPEHCNELQRHESCECVCINNDERTKCLSNPKKVWDKNKCHCSCKELDIDCTTGLEFDEGTCSCVAPPQPVSTRLGSVPDGRYETKSVTEKRIRRWPPVNASNANNARYTIVPSR